jgi:hypothetical protein
MPFENLLPPNSDTLMSISSFGTLLYQARGIVHSLSVIGGATQLERTVNGTLTDFSAPQFRKYSLKLNSPSDVNAPPIDNIFPGMEVVVQCAVGFSFVTGTVGLPHKSPVSGSLYTEGAYTFYRPELTMLVRTVETTFDEWKNVVGWSMELEEK